jgi:hypothetical protein
MKFELYFKRSADDKAFFFLEFGFFNSFFPYRHVKSRCKAAGFLPFIFCVFLLQRLL